MSELDQAKAALLRSATDGPGLRTAQTYRSPDAAAGWVVDHINQCVLPDRFDVLIDEDLALTLEASDRRVLRIAATQSDLDPLNLSAQDGLATEDAGSVAALILAVCQGGSLLEIRRADRSDSAQATKNGPSALALFQALGLQPETYPGHELEPLLDLVLGNTAVDVQEAVLLDGESATILRGQDAKAQALIEWSARLLNHLFDGNFPMGSALETHGALILAPNPEVEGHILVAGRVGRYAILHLAGHDTAATWAAWREAEAQT